MWVLAKFLGKVKRKIWTKYIPPASSCCRCIHTVLPFFIHCCLVTRPAPCGIVPEQRAQPLSHSVPAVFCRMPSLVGLLPGGCVTTPEASSSSSQQHHGLCPTCSLLETVIHFPRSLEFSRCVQLA